MSVTIPLPYPPSMNHYWRSRIAGSGKKQFVSVYVGAAGKKFRADVAAIVRGLHGKLRPLDCRLRVELRIYAPDRRKRDLDNLAKACLDSLTHAGVWVDDSQIDELEITRGPVRAPIGALEVRITQITQDQGELFA